MSTELLIDLFNSTFGDSERVELVRGESEPIYLPRDEKFSHDRIYFAHGFFSSALHEIAHWCVAGRQRRRLIDYGYWYCPDGRTRDEQLEFERVEVRPQAIEWIFSVAAGREFNISADNLGLVEANSSESRGSFQQRVAQQALVFIQDGLPPRASQFVEALAARFGTGDAWRRSESYRVEI